MVQQLKELCRMHMDRYGSPGPLDDHLPERDLNNVLSVLEPLGNMLKGSLMLEMVLVIFENTEC
jgi:hypothetical protein